MSEEKLESWGVELTSDIAHSGSPAGCVNCKSPELFCNSRWMDCIVGFSRIMERGDNYLGSIIVKCPNCDRLQWFHISQDMVVVLKAKGKWLT